MGMTSRSKKEVELIEIGKGSHEGIPHDWQVTITFIIVWKTAQLVRNNSECKFEHVEFEVPVDS